MSTGTGLRTDCPLTEALTQLREAVTLLGYDDGMLEMLGAPRREVTVSIPLRRYDGSVELQANQAYRWSESEVEARLAERMTSAWLQVLSEAERHRLSLRTAATCLAVRRVAEAHRQRGLYP